jgi:hypothetical protein
MGRAELLHLWVTPRIVDGATARLRGGGGSRPCGFGGDFFARRPKREGSYFPRAPCAHLRLRLGSLLDSSCGFRMTNQSPNVIVKMWAPQPAGPSAH